MSVMPGALIIGPAQSAGTLVMFSLKKNQKSSFYLLTVDKAKFRKPIPVMFNE